jgi:diguanylate cyclase (GGDEF)-like protein
MAMIILLEVALAFIIAFLVIRAISRSIIKPINELTDAAAGFYREESMHHSSFSSLDIKTGDEIETLSESMKQMERDINDNTAHILELSEELFESRTEAIHLNELAKKDALTGVRNKYSYDEEIKVIDFAIKGGDTQIGLAIFDLDDLKGINDTYGHATGDIAIRSLAQLICRVFDHSPVFRIGGDEFVAVLRGHDYEHAEELVDEFKDLIGTIREDKSLGPGERISASLGYALYNKRDGGVSGLFKRADSDMYERKRAYKMSRD